MKTKTTNGISSRLLFATGALLAFSLNTSAQNSSLDADLIPLPGGNQNAVLGGNSMMSTTTGNANVAVGYHCMTPLTSGGANTAVGYGALNQNQGDFNTCVGVKSQASNTFGHDNTSVGAYALNNNDGKYNSAFGMSADVSFNSFGLATAIGAFAVCNNSSRVWLGDVSSDVWTQNMYFISDGRFKKNINPGSVKGLDFIKLLRPVTYNFDSKGFTEYVTKNMSPDARKAYVDRDFTKKDAEVQTGFIAQEVELAAKASGYNFSGVHAPEGETDTYGVSYYQFVVPLVKAVQEQQEMIEKLQQQVSSLQKSAGATGVNQQGGIESFNMGQNEPNPFTHETVVSYNLPETVNNAYMAVYDLSGKQLATFPITQKGSGSMTINADKLSAGIYLYSIVADGKVFDSKKMIVADK